MGRLFRVEEEVKGEKLDDEIFEAVLKKLEDKDAWEEFGEHHVHHKTENICLRYDMDWASIQHKLTEPEYIACPKQYGRRIQKLVRNILGFNENEKKIFALDYINGEFAGYLDFDNFPNDKEAQIAFQEWLDKEVTPEHYVVRKRSYMVNTYYFRREADHAFLVLKWL